MLRLCLGFRLRGEFVRLVDTEGALKEIRFESKLVSSGNTLLLKSGPIDDLIIMHQRTKRRGLLKDLKISTPQKHGGY